MKSETQTPIEIDFKSARSGDSEITPGSTKGFQSLKTFTSYSFDKNILVPASAFRFTAPGIDKSIRTAIRSGDLVELFAVDENKEKIQIGTGFVDETDTHINESTCEYVITGRDGIGQLVDNAAVDKDNRVVQITKWRLADIMEWALANTRLPQEFIPSGVLPNATFIFRVNPGETKINTLQRYFEFMNLLIWSAPNGQVIVGKPDFTQDQSGILYLDRENPYNNNVIEARVRRNLNTAIRQIVTILQSLENVNVNPYTDYNSDSEMEKVRDQGVGRSVFRTFHYGAGEDLINQIEKIAASSSPFSIGRALSFREIARDNMKLLDVEIVVQGHLNSQGKPYDIDQVYDVMISDDDVHEPMYVYACSYNLTESTGMMTTLRLCRLFTIVAYAEQLKGR